MADIPKSTVFLYGKKSVFERLKTDPGSIRKVFFKDGFDDTLILELVSKTKIPSESLTRKKFDIRKTRNVQGVAAQVEPFRYTPYCELLERYFEEKLSIIFLDGVNDPHNLGVILRTLACLGGFGVVLLEKSSCGVNETVMHVAVGGENYTPVAKVESMCEAVGYAKNQGIPVYVSVAESGAESIYKAGLRRPSAVVFGSENDGVSGSIIGLADRKIHIPTYGAGLSLNLNTACAVICSAIASDG